MSAGLLAVAIAFTKIPINTETLELEVNTVTTPAIIVLVFIIWFVFFYGVSVGNTAWMSTGKAPCPRTRKTPGSPPAFQIPTSNTIIV